jgi:hypothetical protein
MLGCAVQSVADYRRGEARLAICAGAFVIFVFLGAALFLLSLRLGEQQRRAAERGENRGLSHPPPSSPPGQRGPRAVRYLVWSGVVCLMLNFIPMTVVILAHPVGTVSTKILLFFVMLSNGLGLILLIAASVAYVLSLLRRPKAARQSKPSD